MRSSACDITGWAAPCAEEVQQMGMASAVRMSNAERMQLLHAASQLLHATSQNRARLLWGNALEGSRERGEDLKDGASGLVHERPHRIGCILR